MSGSRDNPDATTATVVEGQKRAGAREARELRDSERFEVLRALGEGGMGKVYEVFDRVRASRLALKTLVGSKSSELQRFKNEFRALQDLHHPNLVVLHELLEDAGTWFFTMELVDGVDFTTWVRGSTRRATGSDRLVTADLSEAPATAPDVSGQLDEARLRAGLVQLAHGLLHLHAAGMVHRDIKPSNVLVTSEGRVVVLDFGLVTEAVRGPAAKAERVVGSIPFMAPEQATEEVGPAADWYALGVVIYQALTGTLPYQGDRWEVLERKRRMPPPMPSQLNPDVPLDLERLCLDLLRIRPEERPSGADVLARLGDTHRGDSLPTEIAVPRAQHVGREQEAARLRDAFARNRRGLPAAIFVEGESGIGKSTLVRRFTEQLVEQFPEAVAWVGRCYERESIPFRGFEAIVEQLARHLATLSPQAREELISGDAVLLAQVFPELDELMAGRVRPRVSSVQEVRSRAFASFRQLLRQLASRQPLVLVIEDLHWAGADSLALLAELLRAPDPPAVLIVATTRVTPEIAIAHAGVELVKLERLPSADAHALAVEMLPPAHTALADDLVHESAGNPLVLTELARHVMVHGRRGRLEDGLAGRTRPLTPEARLVLELVSLAEAPLSQHVVLQAAALPFTELARPLAELRIAHLVRTSTLRRGDAVEPYHDRVRQAVRSGLDESTRISHHAALADALEATAAYEPEELAHHLRAAGNVARALAHTLHAAEQATASLAFARAARLYRQALDLGATDAAVHARLGDALANDGRGAEAAAAYLAGAAVSTADREALQRKAAEQLLLGGHVDRALAALDPVLRSLRLSLPPTPMRALVALLMRRMRLRMRGLDLSRSPRAQAAPDALDRVDVSYTVSLGLGIVDTVRGAAMQAQNVLLALDAGEPVRIARALSLEGSYVGAVAGPDAMAPLLAIQQQIAAETGAPAARAYSHWMSGYAHHLRGAWHAAIDEFEQADAIVSSECVGMWHELATNRMAASYCWIMAGRIDLLATRALRWYHEARERGDLYAQTTLATGPLNTLWLAWDDPKTAAAEAAAAMERWPHSSYDLQRFFNLLAQTFARMYQGDLAGAYDEITGGWRGLRRSFLLRVRGIAIPARHTRARAALALAVPTGVGRQRRKLLAVALRDARWLEREDRLGWGRGFGTLVRAGAAHIRGDDAEAVRALREARDFLVARDMAMHAEAANHVLARLPGGSEADCLAAEAALLQRGVRDPGRWVDLLIPGFVRRSARLEQR